MRLILKYVKFPRFRLQVPSSLKAQGVRYSSKVPRKPTWEPADTSNFELPEISEALAKYLERTSLVMFESQQGIQQLHEAIVYVSQIQNIPTDGVEPLHSLLEDGVAYLREDIATTELTREETLSQATKTVEDWYFVAPPGNIPLDSLATSGDKPPDR
ncbi:glutamyl-tRNA(Gln) amidotransferase subunit C, mitochondrial-like [Watersipora subatra]|uniref:glutamyl-tRNA(Gln) amidotransferase subunit C, mitochondrial-like n=1 Tax=Watersipora subatra TaxID=2589382 RepID=UPI00355B1FED